MMRHRAISTPRRGIVRRGFTLIEAVLCLGVLMILVSMVLPTVGRSIERGRQTRDSVQLRQNFTLVTQYAHDHKGVYPVASASALSSGRHWYRALLATGMIQSPAEVDPAAYRRWGDVTLHLSVSLVCDPSNVIPGQSMPLGLLPAAAVTEHRVSFPMLKGAMLKTNSGGAQHPETMGWFCCTTRWRAPVTMCDGATFITDYIEISGGVPPVIVDSIGIPVWTTWGGALGRDK
jgi:type II secretory pathway pseudopilin PulG